MKNLFFLVLFLSMVLFYCAARKGKETTIQCRLINLNAQILVVIDKTQLLDLPDTITVYRHQIDRIPWRYDDSGPQKDTSFVVENSYLNRGNNKKLPPHLMNYARAVVLNK